MQGHNVFFASSTEDTLEEVQKKIDLPDPQLFLIVNSKSKVSKMIWQGLINVDVLKSKLKSMNWLYSDVIENSLDDASCQIVKSVCDTSSKMLEKVSAELVSVVHY